MLVTTLKACAIALAGDDLTTIVNSSSHDRDAAGTGRSAASAAITF